MSARPSTHRVLAGGEAFEVSFGRDGTVVVRGGNGTDSTLAIVEAPGTGTRTLEISPASPPAPARAIKAAVADSGDAVWVAIDGEVFAIEIEAAGGPRPRRRDRQAEEGLSAPMPATLTKVLVAPGARVRRGDTLLLLEAMKMEMPVKAPRDGVVARILFSPGDLVQPGTPILELSGTDD
jgi:biotin carboxyl carrier protein